MSLSDRRRPEISTQLPNLSISNASTSSSTSSITTKSSSNTKLRSSAAAASKQSLAENWDDESSDTETESGLATGISTGSSAPPPTPLTPNAAGGSFDSQWSLAGAGASAAGAEPMTPMRGQFRPDEKRPEKSTAVAARMIAAGLGVRAPKKSEEALKYEKAVREQEERRVREEKAEAQRAEEARRAAWED